MNPLNLIKQTRGRFFSVTFVKRDSTIRHMNARLGVRKNITGVGLKFDPAQRNIVIGFDIQKKAYRCIPCERVTAFRCGSVAWSNNQQIPA